MNVALKFLMSFFLALGLAFPSDYFPKNLLSSRSLMPVASSAEARNPSTPSLPLANEKEVAELLKNLYALRITEGCSQGCTHCALSPLRSVQVMPYSRIIWLLEIAKKYNPSSKQIVDREICTYHSSEPFDYYDSAADKDFGDVVAAILNYFPEQQISITTRGWYLGDKIGPRAAKKIAKLMKQYPEKIHIRISIDLYNIRRDVARYIYRVCKLIHFFPEETELNIAPNADPSNEEKTKHILANIFSLTGPRFFQLQDNYIGMGRISPEGRAKKIKTTHYHDPADCMYGIHIFPDGTVQKKIRLTEDPLANLFVEVHHYKKIPLSLWNSTEAKISLLPKNGRPSTVNREVLNEQLLMRPKPPLDSFHLIQSQLKRRELKKMIKKFKKAHLIGSIWLGKEKTKENRVTSFFQGLWFEDMDPEKRIIDDNLDVALPWNTTYDLYIKHEDREIFHAFVYSGGIVHLIKNKKIFQTRLDSSLIRKSKYSLYIVPRRAKLNSLSKNKKALLRLKEEKKSLKFSERILRVNNLLAKDETLFPEIKRKEDDFLFFLKNDIPPQKKTLNKETTEKFLDEFDSLFHQDKITLEFLKKLHMSGITSYDFYNNLMSTLAVKNWSNNLIKGQIFYVQNDLKATKEKFSRLTFDQIPALEREKNKLIDPKLEADLNQFMATLKKKFKSQHREKIKETFLEFLKGNCEMFELVESLRQTGLSQKEAQELILSYLMMDKEDEVIDLRLSRRSPLATTLSQEVPSLASAL